jgi:hypothetical protein
MIDFVANATCTFAVFGSGTNGILSFLQIFFVMVPCASLEMVSEKVESLTRKTVIYHTSLRRMQKRPLSVTNFCNVRRVACMSSLASYPASRQRSYLRLSGMSIPRERTSISLIAPAPKCTESGFRRSDTEGILQSARYNYNCSTS